MSAVATNNTHQSDTPNAGLRAGGENIARRMKTTFDTTIKKIGASHYVLIKKETMESMQLREGDDIDVTICIPTLVEDRRDA